MFEAVRRTFTRRIVQIPCPTGATARSRSGPRFVPASPSRGRIHPPARLFARKRRPISRGPLTRILAVVPLLALLAACATSPPASHHAAAPPFPSPLSGPGVPAADSTVRRHVDRGWRELLGGRLDAARLQAQKAGGNPAAQLLNLQAQVMEAPGDALDGLEDLVAAKPGYASAWITLSYAAEETGREARALEAARKSAGLWGSPKWLQRVAQLEDRWIGSRLAQASNAIESGEWQRAAELANATRAIDEHNRQAELILARAEMGMGNDEAALSLLGRLPGDPDAILLKGEIAERRKEWSRALELYQQLPLTDPRREPALERAKRRWRIANLPLYVQAALNSSALTRNDLAILTANLLPELMALPPKNVQVISDIVDLPSQREIVTMVAAGLMRADPIEHTFEPDGPLSASETRRILEGAIRLTGRRAPVWCDGAPRETGCFSLSDPPSGQEVAAVLIAMEEVPPHE